MNAPSARFDLADDRDPRRVVRGRIDGPSGWERASPPLPHVIVLHGFKGFMDWGFFPVIARRIAACGAIAVRYNASGSGVGPDLETFSEPESFARNTASRELEDLEALRRRLAETAPPGLDRARAALFGHSRGGAVALIHAAEHGDVASLVAWSPIATFARFDAETIDAWRRDGCLWIHNARTGDVLRLDRTALDDLERHRERLDVVAACARSSTAKLLIHGSADETVPLAEHERLAAVLLPGRDRSVVIEGAGHTYGASHPLKEGAGEEGAGPPSFEAALAESLAWIGARWS